MADVEYILCTVDSEIEILTQEEVIETTADPDTDTIDLLSHYQNITDNPDIQLIHHIQDDVYQSPEDQAEEYNDEEDQFKEDQPEEYQPEEYKPEVDQPEEDKPEVDQPEEYKPEVDQPEEDKPEVDQPEVDQPEVDQPEVDQPDEYLPDDDQEDEPKHAKEYLTDEEDHREAVHHENPVCKTRCNGLMIIIKDHQVADGTDSHNIDCALPNGLVIKPSGVSALLKGVYTSSYLMPGVTFGPYNNDVLQSQIRNRPSTR